MGSTPLICAECRTEIAPGLQACPVCNRLVHAETLKELAGRAESAEKAGEVHAALSAWRDALSLLPPETRQHAVILEKVQALSARVEDQPHPQSRSWRGGAAGLGGLLVFALTKGKFLLLGLTKLPTLLSMFFSVYVFMQIWSWKFALGFFVCIYIHEMGHIWMLHRYGIRAIAPMFVPGLGAFVRLKQSPATAIEDARVGLAGPIWGLAASGACYAIYVLTGMEYWGALAMAGGMINLFNMIPVWQLDGGRGFRSLTRGQRWLASFAAFGVYYFTSRQPHESDLHFLNVFLLAIGGFGVARALWGDAPPKRDDVGLFQFVLLVMLLGALAAIDVQVPLLR